MVNQDLERILGCFFDGEEPNRGFMKSICLLSFSDRLRGSEGANTRRLGVLEPCIGSVEVEVTLASVVVVVALFRAIVLSASDSAKRSGSEVISSSKRSSISTLGTFLCTVFRVLNYLSFFSRKRDENDEPTDVKWMARLLERCETEEKHLIECFKKKLVIVM